MRTVEDDVQEPARNDTEKLADREQTTVGSRLAIGALDYAIPVGANRITYMLGGLTAFFILVLILTGLYLAQFYQPDPAGAHDSVLYILTRAPLGDWIRSIHYWSAAGVTLTVAAHLVHVFLRRSYRRPREVTWWAGVALVGLLFLLVVTGSSLRYDQEGFEALEHFVAGGHLTAPLGSFFTDAFTPSTSLLARVFSLHTSLLPLLLVGLMGLHFWLIRHLGIHAEGPKTTTFRSHAVRLGGVALLAFAAMGLLAVFVPENLGYAPVPGAEVTKPFWPVLWVYGLENLLGMWGMVLGPAVLFGFLLLVPLLDRHHGERSRPLWLSSVAAGMAAGVLALWLYGVFGAARQHLGM